jgi:hypothetical protein
MSAEVTLASAPELSVVVPCFNQEESMTRAPTRITVAAQQQPR